MKTTKRVEIFTKEEFESQALPVNKETGDLLWKYLGIRGSEHAYLVEMPHNNIGIEVRSSVRDSGKSAGTGEDSIRCWLVDVESSQPMGSKVSRWTTRLPGWGERTKEVIRQLWVMGQRMVDCPSCKQEGDTRLRCYKVRKEGPNKGKLFLKCPNESCAHFEWMNSDEDGEVTVKTEAAASPHGSIQSDPCPDCAGTVKLWESRKEGNNKGRWFYSCGGPTGKNGEKGCGFFQWMEEEIDLQRFTVEISSEMSSQLAEFLKGIGGKIITSE